MYTVAKDPHRSTVLLTFSGFLSVEEVARYADEIRSTLIRGRMHTGFALLIDISGALIQSQEVVAAFQAHIETMPRSRRIAVVTGGSLARMQIRRLLPRTYAKLFDTVVEARAWLDRPETLAA